MIGEVIQYLDLFLKPLGFKPLGLATQIVDDVKQPATYLKNGEVRAVNIEPNVIYHRIITGPGIERESGPIGCTDVQKRTYRIRLFASFDRNLICLDSLAGVDTVMSNFLSVLNNQNIKELKQAFGLNSVSTSPLQTYRDREAWELEIGAPFNGKMGIVAVDYSVELKGNSTCFEILGCGGEPIDVIELVKEQICDGSGPCEVATVTLNGVEFGTVAAGGTLAGLVQYVNGTPVGSLVGAIWTIPDPLVCADATVENSDITFTQAIASGDTYVLEDYEFEFQNYSGGIIATEIRPAMIAETFNFATGLTYQYNLNINGVFSQVVEVTAGDDININIG